jgi:hypothetical protein
MGQDTQANGQGVNRLAEHSRDGAESSSGASRRSRSSRDKDARPSGPYDKPVRLCLNVPLHIVKRLEAHAVAMGKSRDVFATECLGRYMQANYSKRDEHLRNAYGVSDQPQESQPAGTPQGD